MIRIWLVFCASAVFFAVSAVGAAAEPEVVQVRGFAIDYAAVGYRTFERIRPSLERQMDIIEHSGVNDAVMGFFKTVPIILAAQLNTGFGRASVQDGRQIVQLKAAQLPRDRPILLHELLHAYHGQVLGPTPMIRDSYRQAVQRGLYRQYAKAHFLENPREYFAVIASIYLYGEKIDQPPYECALIMRNQPQFIAFLAERLGPHACK